MGIELDMKEELGEGLYGYELYVWLRMEMIFNARDIYPHLVWAGPSYRHGQAKFPQLSNFLLMAANWRLATFSSSIDTCSVEKRPWSNGS